MESANAKLNIIGGLAAVALTFGVITERHAWANLSQTNADLRQRLAGMDDLRAENLRLSNLLAQARDGRSQAEAHSTAFAATDERGRELAQLRKELETLREQDKQVTSLHEDTRQARASLAASIKNTHARSPRTASAGGTPDGSQLEILKANYWTADTNMDVADALSDRIRGDSLKAVASNNLNGDPEFGQVKHLTVVYQFGGVTFTNEFREGDLVILPAQ